jgi:O-antigen/teichoic acid export membrane protein
VKILRQAGSSDSFSGNAFFIFLIRFFPSLANALVIVLFSQRLGQQEYGAYQNFWIQLFVLNTVACLGFPAFIITYARSFIATLLKGISGKYYFYFSFWIVVLAAAFSALQFTTNGINPLIPTLFFIVYALSVIAESLLISFRKFSWLLGVNAGHTLLFIIIHAASLYSTFSITSLFTYLLLLAIVRLLMIGLPALKTVKQEQVQHIDELAIAKARNLWMHIGVYDVSQMLFKWVDKFVISLLLAGQLSAIYFNGSVDIPFLPLLLGAASSAALMQLAQRKGEMGENLGLTLQLVNHSSRLLSAIVFPVFWFLLFYRYELFGVLLSEKYIAAVPIFLVSILALPLRAYSFTTVLQNQHQGRIINTGAVLDLALACSLMYPLYTLMGLPGVALSFVISSYLQGGYYLYHTGKVLGVSIGSLVPFGNLLIKLIVFALLFIGIHYLSVIYFTPQIVLFSGMLLAILASVVALAIEFRTAGK